MLRNIPKIHNHYSFYVIPVVIDFKMKIFYKCIENLKTFDEEKSIRVLKCNNRNSCQKTLNYFVFDVI
jgi:hypothetical protein